MTWYVCDVENYVQMMEDLYAHDVDMMEENIQWVMSKREVRTFTHVGTHPSSGDVTIAPEDKTCIQWGRKRIHIGEM